MSKRATWSTLCIGLLAAVVIVGCGKQEGEQAKAPVPVAAPTPATVAPPPAPAASAAAPMPDVGKLETVAVKAEGFGGTASEATAEAMKLAILQVNGATLDMSSVQTRFGLDVTLNEDSLSLRSVGFAERVAQRSKGAITNFKIVNLVEPKQPGERFKASIEANIAKFAAPADTKKIKIVVAPVRATQTNFAMGDASVPSARVAGELRQRVVDALTNTGRFTVLDRDLGADLQSELDMISSGRAPSAEFGKLGQAVTADVLWVGRLNNFAYNRHARKLRASDRELVSYSGGWALNQQVVNVATRQIMVSSLLQGAAPATEPTTLGSGVDSNAVAGDMMGDMVKQIVSTILLRTFPITVISREGNTVVLSQGGQALHEGARYQAVVMGAELKDPQTGQSLGRVESPCCEVVIDRVTPNVSYGHLEFVKVSLENLPIAGLQIREESKRQPLVQTEAAAPAPPEAGQAAATPAPASAPRAAAPRPKAGPAGESASSSDGKEKDTKW